MLTFAYIYTDPLIDPAPKIPWSQKVDRVYKDLGSRQKLEQLLLDCQAEPPHILLVNSLTELGESVAQINKILTELEKSGVEVIATEQNYTTSQIINLNSPDNRADLVKIFAEIQTNQRSRRLRQGHARNRLKALPPPGKAPYGYRRGQERYLINRSTAPVVKDFVEHFLLFGSLRGAVKYLEQKYGKKIAVSTGRRWLTSPVYRGNLSYKGRDIISNTHPAIIEPEEAAQIDRLLRRNRNLAPKTASANRSLAGLVVCQKCQSGMKVTCTKPRNQKQEYLYLRPINCPQNPKCKGIPYQHIFKDTIERICQDLPQAVAQINLSKSAKNKVDLQLEIESKQDILSQINTLQSQDILDEETANLRRYKLRTEIAKLQSKIAQLPPDNLQTIAQAVSLPQFWLDLSESERRFYFREFIKAIEIIRLNTKEWQLKLVLFLNSI